MLENSSDKRAFEQGVTIKATDSDFHSGLQAAVDYRGDITMELKDDSFVEGFLFNSANGRLDIFPKNSPQKKSVKIEDLKSISFSGKDEALGKSWDEWVKKRGASTNSSVQ